MLVLSNANNIWGIEGGHQHSFSGKQWRGRSQHFSVREEASLVKFPGKDNHYRFGNFWLPRPEPCPCSMLGQWWCCWPSVCGGGTAGNSLPSPWSGQQEEHDSKRQEYVPASHLDTAWNARRQLQQNKLHVWQYQECSGNLPKIFNSLSYLEERFSALQNYIKIQFDWQMSAFSTIDANFINWLCHQRKYPYNPSHCFCRWRSRYCTCMCKPHLHI